MRSAHGAELREDRPPRVEAAHERRERLLGVLLLAELGVDVARQVVAQVFADAKLLEVAPDVGQLLEDVLGVAGGVSGG